MSCKYGVTNLDNLEELKQLVSEFTREIVSEYSIKCVGKTFNPKHSTIYRYISEDMPLCLGSEIPPLTRADLIEKKTCGCTNGKYIFFDEDLFAEQFKEICFGVSLMRAQKGQMPIDPKNCPTDDIYESIKMVILHEYTHVLCQHVERLRRFARQSKNQKNIETYSMAEEIEANRGYGINCCPTYEAGVTEDVFPETKGVDGLQNIYEVLKRVYGDQIDNTANGTGEGEGQGEQGEKKLSDEQKKAIKKSVEQRQGHHSEQKSTKCGGDGEGQGTACSDEGQKEGSGSDENRGAETKSQGTGADNLDAGMSDKDEQEGGGSPHIAYGGIGTTTHLPSLDEIEGQSVDDITRAAKRKYMADFFKKETSRLKGMLAGTDIAVGREATYSRPSRKESDGGLIRKGVKRGKVKAPTVLIAMDSSGSMNGTTSRDVLNAIEDLMRVLGRSMKGSYVCMHDHEITTPIPLYRYEEVVKRFRADGGNDFNNVLREANRLGVQMVLNVGDGYDTITDWAQVKIAKGRGLRWVDVNISEHCPAEITERMMDEEAEFYSQRHEVNIKDARAKIILEREVVKLR